MSSTIKTNVMEQLETLPENLQRQVLAFVQALQAVARQSVSGRQLLQFAGAIPADDLELMRQAIENGCEQVDLNEFVTDKTGLPTLKKNPAYRAFGKSKVK